MSGSMIDIMVYVWGRRNSHARLNVMFVTVRAPYLPYVLAGIAMLMGGSTLAAVATSVTCKQLAPATLACSIVPALCRFFNIL